MLLNEELLKNNVWLAHSQYANRENTILNENASIFNKNKKYDVFLSHSYLDKDLILSLVELFNKADYSVYVDWKEDPELDRTHVTVETAAKLRKRMQSCKCLAYVSTSNISSSKWCPWELGYVDGEKNGRCAILPIVKTKKDTFKGQEYLGLYPYIDYETIKGKDVYDFWVNDPNDQDRYVRLRYWLEGKDIYNHNEEER